MMGLLFDLIGGAADAGSQMLQQQMKEEAAAKARSQENEQMLQRQKSLAEYQSDLEMKKQVMLDKLKSESKRREELELSKATETAETRAKEIGSDRRFESFMKDGKAAGYFDGMSEDQIRDVFNTQYDNMRVNNEAGGDRYVDKKRSEVAADFLKASRETGNTGLISSALKGVDDARMEDKLAIDEKKAALAKDKQDQWYEIQQRLADIKEAASEKRASSDKAVAVVDSARKFLSDQYSDLKAREKALNENLSLTPEAKAKAAAEMQSERADLDKKSKQLDVYFERLFSGEKRLSGEQPAAEKPKDPQGKAYDGVNPDGSVRYKPASGSFTDQKTGKQYPVVDLNAGKSDSVEIIRKEYEKAVASGNSADASALARELKRLGVNVSNESSQSNPSGGQSNRIVSIKRVG